MPLFTSRTNCKLLASFSFMIFGVTKISNSFFSSTLKVLLNRNPMPGISAKKVTGIKLYKIDPSLRGDVRKQVQRIGHL